MNRKSWTELIIAELLARYSASDVYTEEAPKKDESNLLIEAINAMKKLKEFYIKEDLIRILKGTIYSQMKSLVKQHKLCKAHLTDLTREDKQYLENRVWAGDRLLWVAREDGTYLTKLEKPPWSNELHQHHDGRWIHLSELIQMLTNDGEKAFLIFVSKKKRRTHCYGSVLEVVACPDYRHGWRFVNEQAYPTLNPKEKEENENGSSVEQTNEENQKVPPRGNGN